MHNLEVSRDEIEKIRREGGSKLEKDRASIAGKCLPIRKRYCFIIFAVISDHFEFSMKICTKLCIFEQKFLKN